MTASICHSPSWHSVSPVLSILVPFYRDDALDLIHALQDVSLKTDIELLLYDDGTNDAPLTQRLSQALKYSPIAVQLTTCVENRGRSAARNALQRSARAEWVLFLDADMRPARPDFVQNYLDLIGTAGADMIFGGFEVEASSADPDRELHRALSKISDCLDLSERQAAGPQYVASSNLCVSKTVLDQEPFDDGFSGWGWEDSEWAARAAKRFTLLHTDNPAIHLGLETTDTLLNRFATSGPNYKRFTTLHPDLAPSLSLYRISSRLGHLPGQKLMRPTLKSLTKAVHLPMRLRLAALKLWRASHYAEALR